MIDHWQKSAPVVEDSRGFLIHPDGMEQSFSYNAGGQLEYVEITDGTSAWRQTFTYVDGKLTGISQWVMQ